MSGLAVKETNRLDVQRQIDESKTQAERNKLGQFATPTPLAREILEYGARLLRGEEVRFLDPAFGTGAFYSALLHTFPASRIASVEGFEIDPRYGRAAQDVWRNTQLSLHIEDFARARSSQPDSAKANLLICNPPYVRHHHLGVEEKRFLRGLVKERIDVEVSGLTGLYGYFLFISHSWMAENGVAGWLIPSEFMDVNYGRAIKEYLLDQVTLLRIHRFDPEDVQFDDALVSSAVVWFRQARPARQHQVEFTFGGSLASPRFSQTIALPELRAVRKWTSLPRERRGGRKSASRHTLADLFTIKRGLATGANKFFMLSPKAIEEHQIPPRFLRPILPSARYLQTDEVEADSDGNPVGIKALFLLDSDLPEAVVRKKYPKLWSYLQKGVEEGIDKRYICSHRPVWYQQERRPAAPFLCTYMGRKSNGTGNPFRFILNRSKATAANTYLMLYPKPHVAGLFERNPALLSEVLRWLNGITPETLIEEGRVYGGGLHKVEPRELANVPVDKLFDLLSGDRVGGEETIMSK